MKKSVWTLVLLSLLWPGLLWAQDNYDNHDNQDNPLNVAEPMANPAPTDQPPPDQPAYSEPGPKMVLLETEYDAQLNPPGSSISHQFEVRNEGDDNLRLEVVPGCGCTVTNYDRVISPGASGTITVTVDLYDAWAGRAVNKAVTVSSNDPKTPLTRLIMRAKVDDKR
ncbi:MAG: DUF1573 domain-containing protein [Deltaproteobacteria bacterium]|jgi:hypothetical protein|nr:DUF1573 domain-containing protein [Deltaproteobacteria bacterium]